MARHVARFEPPASESLRAAAERFDCVTRKTDAGEEDPGEVFVRDFVRTGQFEEAARAGTSTTYIAADPDDAPDSLIGYVTLALTQIRLSGGEKKAAEIAAGGAPDFGAVRIGMIGVDRAFVGQGFGRLLLNTAVLHTARISREVSVRFVVADAVETQLDWYRRQGFVENNAELERDRLERVAERTGVRAVSMRLDLGPDPRDLLDD